jgi:hypothetical protein
MDFFPSAERGGGGGGFRILSWPAYSTRQKVCRACRYILYKGHVQYGNMVHLATNMLSKDVFDKVP